MMTLQGPFIDQFGYNFMDLNVAECCLLHYCPDRAFSSVHFILARVRHQNEIDATLVTMVAPGKEMDMV